ncbi:hypothetical protein ACF3NG_07645 [Aerococcaceae bacterium WGS1372]
MAKNITPHNPPVLSSEEFYGITLVINVKTKNEVDDFFELVVSLVGTIIKTSETVSWGGYSRYFQDLESYTIWMLLMLIVVSSKNAIC